MKKILFAASECVPFIKTGGLADVCGALPKEFDPQYWDIRVVIPNYSCIPEHFRSQFEYVTHFYMGTGSYIPSKYVGVLKYELDGITYYFIDNKEYFDCFHLMEISDRISKNSVSLIRQYYLCFLLSASSRILSIVMTGKQVSFRYI